MPFRGRGGFTLAVTGAVVLSLALDSFRLAKSGLTFDEAATIAYARLDVRSLFAALQSSDVFFGAYYGWMHVWMRLGESEAVLRWFSILCAAGAVIALAFLARRLSDTKAGVAAAILAATSPLLFDLARQARPYSLLVLVAALSSLAFLRASERPSWPRWTWYVLISAAGCYVHLFLLCLGAAHALWAVICRRDLYRSGLTWALVAIAFSTTPLLVVLHHYPSVNGYIARPTWRALVETWDWFAGSRVLVVLTLVLVAAWITVRLHRRQRILTSKVLFLIATIAVPPLLVFAESLILKPSYMQRYLVEAWPSYIVALAIILTRLRPLYLVPVAALVLALQTGAIVRTHMIVAQNWRTASSVIFAGELPGDQLVVFPAFGMLPYEYYRERLRVSGTPALRFPRLPPFPLTMTNNDSNKFAIDRGALVATADRPSRIWFLVGWTDDPRTGQGLRILTRALPSGYRLALERRLVHETVLRYDLKKG
jgi:mannosyltransferase